MAYFDNNDKVYTQLKERFSESSLGPTITLDPVTGETILGGKKNPTVRDWQKAYEGYIQKGGEILNTPLGMSASKMYQHPLFKGKGYSYYSSTPYTSTFLKEMQGDIGTTPEEEEKVITTPTTSVRKFTQPEEPYQDDAGGSPPSDPPSSGWDIASGPELFNEKGPVTGLAGRNTFSVDPLKSAGLTAFKELGKKYGVASITGPLAIGITVKDMISSLFGDSVYDKNEKDLLNELKEGSVNKYGLGRPIFSPALPTWGDAEGSGYVDDSGRIGGRQSDTDWYNPQEMDRGRWSSDIGRMGVVDTAPAAAGTYSTYTQAELSPEQKEAISVGGKVTSHTPFGDPIVTLPDSPHETWGDDGQGGGPGDQGGADTDSGTTGQGAGAEADTDTTMGDDL